jgi:glutaredoxin
MKREWKLTRCAPLGLALLLCAASAGAQMFKWTDAKGVVHFSDQPPAGQDVKVETKSFGGGGDQVALPYELAVAAKNSPATLYTTTDCNACDQGRALLQRRGIPFSEKTVTSNDDQQKLREAGSPGQLPLLVVGGNKRVGFEAGAWNEVLSNAAYPKQKLLPANYQQATAVSAAPARPLARDAVRNEQADPVPQPTTPPPAETPSGFRF